MTDHCETTELDAPGIAMDTCFKVHSVVIGGHSRFIFLCIALPAFGVYDFVRD